MGDHSFIQSPPDSTGKRVHAHSHIDGNGDEIHTQLFQLNDPDYPERIQKLDNEGSAFIRFAGGSPSFDVFGRTSVTESDLVNTFKFYQSDHANEFEKKVVGTGDVVFDPAFAGIKLTTGTADGDSVKYTSHRYHHYRPGNGMPCIFTMKAGDIGKTNLIRRVGLFDDDNGVFFEANNIDISVVVRDSLTGLENRIYRSSWNGDRLDGSHGENNKSGQTLDPTKNSIWWIDFQYLGAGAIRFGIYVNGTAYVCHTIGHFNELDRQYMGTASLPFRAEQTNIGVTASSSEMHVFCVVIMNDGYPEVYREAYSINASKTITTETFVPLISFRPAQLNQNGVDNRARILPRLLSSVTTDVAVEFKMSVGCVLTGETFSESIVNCEYDIDATAATGGKRLGSSFLGAGKSEMTDMSNTFELTRDGIWRDADITSSKFITVSVRLIQPGSSVVGIALNLLEIT